jgi:hypothetical protein
MIGSFKDNLVRIDLGLGPAKELDTAGANLSNINIASCISVRFQKLCEFRRQFVQGYPLITNASADVTGQVRLGGYLIGFG